MSGPSGWVLRKVLTKEKLDKQYDKFLNKVNSPDEPDYISMQCGLVKQPAKWIREHMGYDVHETLKKYITCRCLAITGMKDFQVRNEFCETEFAKRLVPNAKSIEAHRPANLTHVLRSMEGPARMLNMKKDYAKMGKLPLDAELLRITDAWLDRILFGDEK